jgi:hypothetical protein
MNKEKAREKILNEVQKNSESISILGGFVNLNKGMTVEERFYYLLGKNDGIEFAIETFSEVEEFK